MDLKLDRRTLLHSLATMSLRAIPGIAGAAVILNPRPNDPITIAPQSLQRALIYLGYLPVTHDPNQWDDRTERALIRFKRHAARPYRVLARTGQPDDVPPRQCFNGASGATLDEATVWEVKQWIERGWKLPLGRFKLELFRYGCLREDVLRDWQRLVQKVDSLGGTLAPPYGDTWRPLGRHKKEGASRLSFHITGRAIDVNQRLSEGGPRQRYFIAQDPAGDHLFWRIYCKTARQDGSQGRKYKFASVECFQTGWNKPYPIPDGYYLDLTEIVQADGTFERIAAHRDWEENYMRTEWWHFQYAREKQPTFLDECELVKISEPDLLAAGYSMDDLDRRPG
ncbi:MAG: hypothetical protein U0Q16_26565 [Bryobacteraceae bacterium]